MVTLLFLFAPALNEPLDMPNLSLVACNNCYLSEKDMVLSKAAERFPLIIKSYFTNLAWNLHFPQTPDIFRETQKTRDLTTK